MKAKFDEAFLEEKEEMANYRFVAATALIVSAFGKVLAELITIVSPPVAAAAVVRNQPKKKWSDPLRNFRKSQFVVSAVLAAKKLAHLRRYVSRVCLDTVGY